MTSPNLFSQAADRNKHAIVDVLQDVLPSSGTVLEIASGSGQHIVHFAQAMTQLDWQPSDPQPVNRQSIRSHSDDAELSNVAAPLDIDVTQMPWPIVEVEAIVCINMLHIAPWQAAIALFQGAAEVLARNSALVTYGPYRRGGQFTSGGDESFDASLRSQNVDWGIRNVEDLTALASEHQFTLTNTIAMPANNFTLLFSRS